VNDDVNQQFDVIEDSDCDDTNEIVSQLQSSTIATDAADSDRVTQDFLAAIEMDFSSPSTCCSIVSVQKASLLIYRGYNVA